MEQTGGSARLVEVKIGQVHLASGNDVNGENAFPFWKVQPDQVWRNIPVMPLPPGNGIG